MTGARTDRHRGWSAKKKAGRWLALGVAGAVIASMFGTVQGASAATTRLDLRVLVIDDGNSNIEAIRQTLDAEGVPYTSLPLAAAGRAAITADYLATGSNGKFQAVVLPDDGSTLPAAELAALKAYEASFGVRQVVAYTWANPAVGLNYAANPGYIGSMDGKTATVTAAGKADGFGYLKGAVPFAAGSYGYLAAPLTATGAVPLPAGASFTSLVTSPIPGSTVDGSLLGVYTTADGVSQLVSTFNYNLGQMHFRMLAHGIVSWMTKGIHLGHNRNYFTFHFDDTFSADARWDMVHKCTPGNQDCATPVTPEPADIRMSPADVTKVASWSQTSGYKIWMAFNGHYAKFDPATNTAYTTPDPLTTSLVANKAAFNWLNHGAEHIYQGCVQDFTVVPWRCVTSPAGQAPAANGSNLTWTSQALINAEIADNIAIGTELGLPFDKTEYLSGEHSGLFFSPQQPVDNPNFAAALTANGIKVIGADASREPAARQVGSATTIPRHPTALYYNTSTVQEAASEYNWLYTPASLGGGCVATAVTTCMTSAIDVNTGFVNYVVPTDSAFDLRFILSNDPRPFYAHVSNLTGPDYLGLKLMDAILGTYNNAFAANAPVVNLSQTQAADVLAKQGAWAKVGTGAAPQVTAYVENGQVTIVNPTTTAAPVTVPAGTTVNGAAFGSSYGGELSGWVNGNATLVTPNTTPTAPAFTSAATGGLAVGTAGSIAVTTSGYPAATVSLTGALPAGVSFTAGANGTATIAGTPAAGTAGTYPLTLTASNASGTATQAFTLTVTLKPAFTSAAATTFRVGTAGTFTVATTGSPAAKITVSGALPAGVTLVDKGDGTATLAGTPAVGTGKLYPLTLTAANAGGSVTQAFTLTVNEAPSFTSAATVSGRWLQRLSFTVTTRGYPVPTISRSGLLPLGVSFTVNNTNGTATVSGTPLLIGTYTQSLTARNSIGTASQSLAIRIG